jgi:hypothetical protein
MVHGLKELKFSASSCFYYKEMNFTFTAFAKAGDIHESLRNSQPILIATP